MRRRTFLSASSLTIAAGATTARAATPGAANAAVLGRFAFRPLPLGAVRPRGWLRGQLAVQAAGLSGHLDEFWPSLGTTSGWQGGDGDSWERGPYYLDGLVPLAYLLGDQALIAKVRPWLDFMHRSARPDGWFGPKKLHDRWPLSVAMKVLMQHHEVTGDARSLSVVRGYMQWLAANPPDWPDKNWRGVRAGENALAALWLLLRGGDGGALETARGIFAASFDWTRYFADFPFPGAAYAKPVAHGMLDHGVNIAMALKYPGLRWALTGDARHRDAVLAGLASLDAHHGQVGGRFSCDEHLSGRKPTQGTELCTVVEEMFSLEVLLAILGDAALADRTEALAYNGLPGALTPDCWAHQYDQQANQVLVSVARRGWSSNDETANLYGLEPHTGCCTANMHQGWPKLVSHMWMATPDGGLAAVLHGPSEVRAKVSGREVTITAETEYPFDGEIAYTVRAPRSVAFPLHLRVPAWAQGARAVTPDGNVDAPAGRFLVVKRTWRDGDTVRLSLPMEVRVQERDGGAI